MSIPYQVTVDNRIYTIVNDLQSSYQVLISGVVRDELTKEAPTGDLIVSLAQTSAAIKPLVFIKALAGGLFCLAGEPGRVFPNLSNTDYELDLQIHVPGYKDAPPLKVAIPKNSAFPLPVTVNVQRPAVRIQGRVTGMTATPTPIPGARVRFVDEPNPPTPLTEHVVAIRTLLHFNHAADTTVRQRQLHQAGTAKQLIASAPMGSQTLTLNDATGLTADDVLLIGSDAVGEYVVIDSLPQDMPGQVLLRNTLNRSFAAGTTVQRYTLGAIGTTTTLAHEAEAGEGVLFLQDLLQAKTGSGMFLPNELPVDTIEIADATAAQVEYHTLGAITDTNDATKGYYRLDGITRVQTVYMDASATGFAAMQEPVAWTIDYGQPVNIVDLRLPLASS